MRMPVLFECPGCGKKHYVAFCAGNDGGVDCARPFVSAFFPSGRDALCPKHQQSARPAAKGAPAPPPSDAASMRCPTTQQQLDIERILADPAGGSGANASSSPPTARPRRAPASPATPRPSSPSTPRPASRAASTPTPTSSRRPDVTTPAAGVAIGSSDEEGDAPPSATYLKCPSCFVIFDRAKNEICPRCGASPDRAPKARPERNTAALESLAESLTFLVLLRWRALVVSAAVMVLGLGALAATTSAIWLTAICLLGVLVVLLVGIGATLVYFRAIETPYYRNQLAARSEGGAAQPSLAASLRSAWSSLKRASPPPDARPAEALEDAPSAELVAASAMDEGELAGAGTGAIAPEASLRVSVRYVGGDPAFVGARYGRLVIQDGAATFESRRGSLRLPAGDIQQVRLRWFGFALAVLLAGGLGVALYLLKPAPLLTYRVPEWIPWGRDFGIALTLAYRAALGAMVAIGSLAALGLAFANHVGVNLVCQTGDARKVVRFRTHLVGALRVARARG